jgi:acetyltransferase
VPDLAIICAPLRDVAGVVAELGERGTRAVIVGPSLHESLSEAQVAEARKAILDAARPRLVRVLGPGSGGLVVPSCGLNASVAPVMARRGKIALVVQSAAIAAAALDRAAGKGIGFSAVVHLGAGLDIDLADVLDWLAEDPETEAILVQFETAPAGRKFMSAARAAARNKPVVAMRGARWTTARARICPSAATMSMNPPAPRRLDPHRHAGRPVRCRRGHGAGAPAARRAPGHRRQRPGPGPHRRRHAAEARRTPGQTRPGDRQTARRADAHRHRRRATRWRCRRTSAPRTGPRRSTRWSPTRASTPCSRCIRPRPSPSAPRWPPAIGAAAKRTAKNIFSCWVGGGTMQEAQQVAAAQGVLAHDSPEKAIGIFLGIVNYERNRELLLQMPPSVAEEFVPDIERARAAVGEALDAGAQLLPPRAARQLLLAYGIESGRRCRRATSTRRSPRRRHRLSGRPGAGAGQRHRARPGGAGAALARGHPHRHARPARPRPRRVSRRARRRLPPAPQRRAQRPAGAAPGRGRRHRVRAGDLPRRIRRRKARAMSVALPPLNRRLAMDLIARGGFAREADEADREALETALATALVRLSQLLTDIDEVTAIELDPIHVETGGVVARERHIHVEKRGRRLGFRRFAIRPYPKELEQHMSTGMAASC